MRTHTLSVLYACAHRLPLRRHWAAPEEISERDRAWQILGFAWRMAIELRISLPLHNLAHVTYRNASEIGLEVINRNRQLTWNLLFCAELA